VDWQVLYPSNRQAVESGRAICTCRVSPPSCSEAGHTSHFHTLHTAISLPISVSDPIHTNQEPCSQDDSASSGKPDQPGALALPDGPCPGPCPGPWGSFKPSSLPAFIGRRGRRCVGLRRGGHCTCSLLSAHQIHQSDAVSSPSPRIKPAANSHFITYAMRTA
jgi:hypothetical protein